MLILYNLIFTYTPILQSNALFLLLAPYLSLPHSLCSILSATETEQGIVLQFIAISLNLF